MLREVVTILVLVWVAAFVIAVYFADPGDKTGFYQADPPGGLSSQPKGGDPMEPRAPKEPTNPPGR